LCREETVLVRKEKFVAGNSRGMESGVVSGISKNGTTWRDLMKVKQRLESPRAKIETAKRDLNLLKQSLQAQLQKRKESANSERKV